MSVIMPAMKILPETSSPPIGSQDIPCHMIFDVKVDFTRKARYVGGGHVTKPPTTQTYASVVSRESVRIAFLYASLNDLKVMSADVQGAYLNAPCKEKVHTRCGPEFGPENVGKIAVIVKALYGLKTSAFAWREHLSHTLESSLEFSHCLADNDVWMRPATKMDGTEYYQYILVHTDDILVVAEDPLAIINLLDQHYVLKPGSIGIPTQYLGAEVGHYHLPDRPERPVWYMGSEKYIKEAIRNVKQWLSERDRILKGKAPSVLPSGYRPELDASNTVILMKGTTIATGWCPTMGR
jgi:Reverse transcriptase (RNA-dependent DNA polymerase)